MEVAFTPRAAKALHKISAFVELLNTPGGGKRYADRFLNSVERLAQPNVKYSLCNDEKLARLNYNCGHYNDWVIAFKITKVYRILHGSLLK